MRFHKRIFLDFPRKSFQVFRDSTRVFLLSSWPRAFSSSSQQDNLPDYLHNCYKEAKDSLNSSSPPIPEINPRSVFANNELHLRKVGAYGYDYDYTVAVYTRELNTLIYGLAVRKLIQHYKYPSEIENLPYDLAFAIRGLHYDINHCVLLKLDAYLQIQMGTAYRGKTALSDEQVKKLYGRSSVPEGYLKNNGQPRMKQLLDLFSLPEIGLLMTVVDYLQQKSIDFDPIALFNDVQNAVASIHLSGQLYAAISQDLQRYVHKNPGLVEFLESRVKAGKINFLISNSPFSFINQGMKYLIGSDWHDLFHYVVVQAKKPRFFRDNDVPFREHNQSTGQLSWERVGRLERGRVYAEGNMRDFVAKTDVGKTGVLYFGDHIFSDLADPMLQLGWCTGAIVPELEREITTQNSPLFQELISWLQMITDLINDHQDVAMSNGEQSRLILEEWLTERDALRVQTKSLFNAQFGSIFRTYHNPSYFSRRLIRLADIYTSRLPNLLQYSTDHTFYPRRYALPHEAVIAAQTAQS